MLGRVSAQFLKTLSFVDRIPRSEEAELSRDTDQMSGSIGFVDSGGVASCIRIAEMLLATLMLELHRPVLGMLQERKRLPKVRVWQPLSLDR